MKNIQNKKINNHGFTLVETLIGLFIFVLAFTALSQVGGNSLQDINVSKKRLVAQYLAEETMEHVKYTQKLYILAGKTKNEFLAETLDCQMEPSGNVYTCDFYFDPSNSTTVNSINSPVKHQQTPAVVEPLKYYSAGLLAPNDFLYPNSSTVSDSPYVRWVEITDIPLAVPDSNAVNVRVVVNYHPSKNVQVSAILHFPF